MLSLVNNMLKVSSELLLKKCGLGFPGGPLVKNPARNAGYTASNPGLEDFTCHGASKPLHNSY